jgi:hypothetical protein
MVMANCVTCGEPLQPERAERYNYCTQPACQERNRKPLEIVAVGVNKAAEQYVALTERTKEEMASGRYLRKQPGLPASTRRRPLPRRARSSAPTPETETLSHAQAAQRQWSKAQEDLALIYRDRGMKPDAIAIELGLSRYLVTQILLAATNRGKP